MSKSNFLNFLVDETLRHHRDDFHAFSDLERKLSDYGISFLRGEFIPQIHMLRFITPMGVIDIPTNWSSFSLEHGQGYCWVKSDTDGDGLLHILQQAWQPSMKSLLVTHSEGYCYIIGLKESDEYYLEDLVNPQEILLRAA